MEFLLYGAYGYTGKLITEMASDFDLKPVLSGRNEEKLKALAEKYSLEYITLDLEDKAKLKTTLERFSLVLHAAGPFKFTAAPMMDACLETGTHYLDITGEIDTFELGASKNQAAKEAGIMIMPGVGFDVVPTDCTAAYLKQVLPDATHLKIAFAMLGSGVSHGTAMTMAESAGEGGARRIDGEITKVPLGEHAMTVPFIGKDMFVMSIPWGDVSTAYYTTGIPNIETFTSVHPKTYSKVKYQKYIGWLLRSSFVKKQMQKRINARPAGPSQERREKGKGLIWGQASNAAGETKTVRLQVMEGYSLTATTALMITKWTLEGQAKPGFQTPAGLFGADLIMKVEGTIREEIG
ncbi:MAG: saccharopine dehydrogenase NADP-binding domain-containing protein [Saprospiraceae bacterium]